MSVIELGPAINCPVCKKKFFYKASEFRPFCGARCKQVDLGHWLSESYTVPGKELVPPEFEDSSEEEGNDDNFEY